MVYITFKNSSQRQTSHDCLCQWKTKQCLSLGQCLAGFRLESGSNGQLSAKLEQNYCTDLKIAMFFPLIALLCSLDNMMEDMDVDLEKEFLHDLKDLKVLVNDKDMLDQHKR